MQLIVSTAPAPCQILQGAAPGRRALTVYAIMGAARPVSPASTLRRFALRLILIGCEYVGTTALGDAIKEWFKEAMGAETGFHEHWKIPHVAHSELTEEEQQQYLALSPG